MNRKEAYKFLLEGGKLKYNKSYINMDDDGNVRVSSVLGGYCISLSEVDVPFEEYIEPKVVKGYKNFKKGLKCREFQFEVGETYVHDGNIALCSEGYHFHENQFDMFKYYTYDLENTETCLIEARGDVITGDDKSVCSEITIVKVLTNEEIKELLNMTEASGNTGLANSGYRNSGDYNSGDYNSGYRNSGDYNSGYYNSGDYNSGYYNSGDYNSGYYNSGYRNSGDYNSGYRNSGDYNSGDYNSGDYNSGYYNSGYFNSDTPSNVRVFNNMIDRTIWNNASKPDFIYRMTPTIWISESEMSDEDKKNHPEYFCQQGYLKKISYKEAWKKAWDSKNDNDLELLKALPNFDKDIFKEITGININE